MSSARWPLAGLVLRTPRLELRLPGPDDLEALAELAAAGVHDPDVMPFLMPWTDAPPDQRALGTMQYHWSRWASWKPSDWGLELVVVRDGTVVGTQGVGAHDFAVLRQVSTGSWLGRAYQGQGIGAQMRAVRDRPVVDRRLRLTRDDWLATRSVPGEIEGLAPCLPMFGVPPDG